MRNPAEFAAIEPTSFDKKLFREYPQPIAAAWSRVFSAKDDSAKLMQTQVSFFEVLARTLVSYFLPEYLRGPADEAVEKILSKGIEKAALGTWWNLLRELVRANGSRPAPFFVHAHPWYFNTGEKPSNPARLIDELCAARNTIAHGVQSLSAMAIRQQLSDALQKHRMVLASPNWLLAYPLFRADIERESTGGDKHGKVQIYRGSHPRAPYEVAKWRASIATDTMYIHHPENGILMVSPFIAMMELSQATGPRLFVWVWIFCDNAISKDHGGLQARRRPES